MRARDARISHKDASKLVASLGKGAHLVLGQFVGDGEKLDLLLALAPNNAVRGVWLDASEFE